MERRTVLTMAATVCVGTLFSGCALIASQKTSENTDNLKPWEIKALADTHYIMDPIFAITNVSSKEEVEAQANILVEKTATAFMLNVIAKEEQYRYRDSIYHISGHLTPEKGLGRQLYTLTTNKRIKDGTVFIEYVQFNVIEVGGVYFFVVGNTNAKNVGFLSTVKDVFIAQSRANQAVEESPYAARSRTSKGRGSWHSGVGAVKSMEGKENEEILSFILPDMLKFKQQNFVDVHVDSTDPRAEQYRNVFIKYFRG